MHSFFLSFSLQLEIERELIKSNILVSNENLPSVHDMSKRNGLVGAPLLEDLLVIDEDDEVVRGALVDDLGDAFTATSHD